MKYEFLSHTADIKFRAFGKTLEGAFENSASAILEYISKGKKIKSLRKRVFEIKGNDYESLLYNFFEELIYLLDVEGFIFSKANVKIKGFFLKAELLGDDAKNYEGLDSIKAATYSEMYIKKKQSIYEIQAVLDV